MNVWTKNVTYIRDINRKRILRGNSMIDDVANNGIFYSDVAMFMQLYRWIKFGNLKSVYCICFERNHGKTWTCTDRSEARVSARFSGSSPNLRFPFRRIHSCQPSPKCTNGQSVILYRKLHIKHLDSFSRSVNVRILPRCGTFSTKNWKRSQQKEKKKSREGIMRN